MIFDGFYVKRCMELLNMKMKSTYSFHDSFLGDCGQSLNKQKQRGNITPQWNDLSDHVTKSWAMRAHCNPDRKIKCHDLWLLIMSSGDIADKGHVWKWYGILPRHAFLHTWLYIYNMFSISKLILMSLDFLCIISTFTHQVANKSLMAQLGCIIYNYNST